MLSSTVVSFGDRVALQCEQGRSGFVCAHSHAEPSLFLSAAAAEMGVPKHMERSVFVLERITSWSGTASAASHKSSAEAEDEPLTFGHYVRIRHVSSGSFAAAHRVRKAGDKAVSHVVRLVLPHESLDASSIWRVVSKYKIKQEGEGVAPGDHIMLVHDQLQLSLSVDDNSSGGRQGTSGSESSKLNISLAPVGTSFSFILNEPRRVAASKDIHAGRCILLFHKEQEAFLTLIDSEPNFGSPAGSPSPRGRSPATRATSPAVGPAAGRRLCLSYPSIRDSTYNIASLSFSSNSLWLLETPDVVTANIVHLSPACYRIKHLASGYYLAASAQEGGIQLVVDIATLASDPQNDRSLWSLSAAGHGSAAVSSAATFFRLTNYVTAQWLHVAVGTSSSEPPTPLRLPVSSPEHPTPVMGRLPQNIRGKLGLTPPADDGFGVALASDDSSESDAIEPSLSRPPRDAPRTEQAYVPEPPSAPAAPEAYSEFISFPLQTSEDAGVGAGDKRTDITLVERPSYVDVFCAVSVPESVLRNVGTVLGHGECLAKLLKCARASSREGSSSRVLAAAQQAIASFRDLIPFCTRSEVRDERYREGLPISANQRILVDQQLHLRAVEVLFAPVVSPYVTLADLRADTVTTTDAVLSWQALGAAVNHSSHVMRELCVLASRFLKLVAKGNADCAQQLAPYLPAMLAFLEPVPEVCGVFSEVARCTELEPDVVRSISRSVLALETETLGQHHGLVDLLHDLCFTMGEPNVECRAVVDKCLQSNGHDLVPQFSIVGGQLNVCCPAATHGDTQHLPVATVCVARHSVELLASTLHLQAAVTAADSKSPALTADQVSLGIEASVPQEVRIAFVRFANSLAALGCTGNSTDGSDHLISWGGRMSNATLEPHRDPAFSSLMHQIVTLLERAVTKISGPNDKINPSEGVSGALLLINACLCFCITCARCDRFDAAQQKRVKSIVFALIAAIPTPRDHAELRAWSEASVRYMECAHHASVLARTLARIAAGSVADKLWEAFEGAVSTKDYAADDDAEVSHHKDVADSLVELVRAEAEPDQQQAEALAKLIELSTYDHPALPNDTLGLAFGIVSPVAEVADSICNRVVCFARTTVGHVKCSQFARAIASAKDLLSVPVLTHLHSDASARAAHRAEISGALRRCFDMARSMPADVAPAARNVMVGFGLHPLLIAELDKADGLASASFQDEEDHGTLVMRALRILVWLVQGDARNVELLVPHFTVFSRLARCAAVFLSEDYCELVHLIVSNTPDATLEVGVLAEAIVAELSQLPDSHLALASLIGTATNEETRAKMRSTIATSVAVSGASLLEVDDEALPGVLRTLAVEPTSVAEASNLLGALPFEMLIEMMGRAGTTRRPLYLAAAQAVVNVHLQPWRNGIVEAAEVAMDSIVILRDNVLPAASSNFFGPRNVPTSSGHASADALLVGNLIAMMLQLPAVAMHHRTLSGAVSDIASTASQYVSTLFERVSDTALQSSDMQPTLDCLSGLLGSIEEYLSPRPPALLTTPLALLRQAQSVASARNSGRKSAGSGDGAGSRRIASSSGGGGKGGAIDERGVMLRWMAVSSLVRDACDSPSADDLERVIDVFGEANGNACLETCIRHLRHSALDEWVTVALLTSIKALLERANDESEAAMIRAQDRLNALEATPLISVLLERPSMVVVQNSVQMGIALLEGGNKKCQDALLHYFGNHDEKFFLTFRKILKEAEATTAHRIKTGCAEIIAPDSPASLVQDLLRLLQLLCEGHHFEFQNYVRHQHDNFNTYNMCVTVMELLHTMLLVLDDTTVPVVDQALNTLTELCQGPCAANQEAIVGCNIVTEVNRLLTDEFEGEVEADDLMGLKSAAIICLSSLLEGSQDATIPNLMLSGLDLSALQGLLQGAWDGREEEDMLSLGFQIYILAGTLISQVDKARVEKLNAMLKSGSGHAYFAGNLCCIEVWRDDDPTFTRLESVFFRKPDICKLREDTREVVLNKVNRSSIVSKHSDFVRLADDLIFEMEHQFGIESFAAEQPAWMNPFGILKAQPRLAEEALLFISFALNLGLLLTDHQSVLFFVTSKTLELVAIVSAVYLITVRFVLLTPLVAHRRHMQTQKLKRDSSDADDDPFLTLPTLREKLAFVATRPNLMTVAHDSSVQMYGVCGLLALGGVLFTPFCDCFLLVLVIHKFPLLRNIVNAITMNGRQLLLTAFLGVVVIYFFSVIGFLFFPEHFAREDGDGDGAVDNNCGALLQCFFYSFSKGLRGGGGISEAMVDNLWGSPAYFYREAYDTLYFVVVAVIVMNIVFALIVDTFAELRDARKRIEEDMITTCFICGIDASTFDRSGEGFRAHTKGAHNMWQYLYFMHHLRRKEKSEYTGQESYVHAKLAKNDLSFFPVNRSKSLENAKALVEEDDYNGPSLAEIKRAVADVVQEKVQEALAKQANAAKAGGPGGATDDNGGNSGGGGSLWGLARARSMAVMKRGGDDGGGSSAAPKKMGITDVVSKALARERSMSSASDTPDGVSSMSARRTEVAKMKAEANELLELLRS